MNVKRFLIFVGKIVLAYVVTSFIVGAISYQFLTKELFEGPDSILATFYRTPAEPQVWNQAVAWAFPVQLIRAFLYAIVLYPFYETLIGWGYWKRFGTLMGFWVVLSVLASSGGTIENAYMMRPEFTTPAILLRTLPEPIAHGTILAAWVARWMAVKHREKPSPNTIKV